ncbi:MAG: GNAT family N-acetyltransferase [Verrucomicrobiia bacterium]
MSIVIMTGNGSGRRRRGRSAPVEVEIRQMQLKDLPAVFELGQKLFTAEKLPTLYRCWDDEEVMNLFGSDSETCLVAEIDGRVVGFALGSVMTKPRSAWRYGWLEWLGVDPAYKRHGIATRLFKQLTSIFIEHEARIMLVDTDEDNTDALAFFRKMGFGQEIKHVYLSMNLEDHPKYIEHKNSQRNGKGD